jgi:DNA-binding NtrC family response regulator
VIHEVFMTSPVLLVVDDDPDALVIIQDWLRFHLPQVTVHTATSSTGALALIKDHDYDAIISDIRMPGMDGLELTTKVLECRPNTPVLLMTAHGDRDLGVKALHTGAYAYVLKPIDGSI